MRHPKLEQEFKAFVDPIPTSVARLVCVTPLILVWSFTPLLNSNLVGLGFSMPLAMTRTLFGKIVAVTLLHCIEATHLSALVHISEEIGAVAPAHLFSVFRNLGLDGSCTFFSCTSISGNSKRATLTILIISGC